MDFIEACRQLIAIDSTPEQGSLSMAELAAGLCRQHGLESELRRDVHDGIEEANLIARLPGSSKKNEVMFQNHFDTVNPGNFGLWSKTQFNPFDAQIIDGHVYGLGSADVKLDFLCKLEAIASFAGKTFRRPPVLVGTYGEETGMMGALRLIRKSMISAKTALVGEPSNLRVITACQGYARVEIRLPFSRMEQDYRIAHDLEESTSSQSKLFSGTPAHASTPHLGESAIKKMMNHLLQLPVDLAVMQIDGGSTFNTVPAHAYLELDPVSGFSDSMAKKLSTLYQEILDLEENFLQYEDRDFNPSHPTLNIGVIATRGDHVMLSGSCRIPPVVTNEVYDGWMKRLHMTCEKLGGEFRIVDYKRPYRTDEATELVQSAQSALRELGLSEEAITQSSTNEASLFSRVGIECISFGPGLREGNIHTPNERVAIEDLKRATAFYKKMIERLCL